MSSSCKTGIARVGQAGCITVDNMDRVHLAALHTAEYSNNYKQDGVKQKIIL